MKKRIALCLVIIFMLGMSIQVNAAGNSTGTLSEGTLSISCQADGIGISYDEMATTKADEIGCRDIVLWEKVGSSWISHDMNGSSKKDAYTNAGSAVYKSAKRGRSYKVTCTHYATFGNVTITLPGETGEMVYN